MQKIDKDVAIIGAGPSGLFSVFECGFLGYSSVVIDSLPQAGGQLTELYPDKPIYDIPAYPHILARDVISKLEEQIAPYKPAMLLSQEIVSLSQHDATKTYTLTTPDYTVNCKAVIIAGGGGVFTPRKPKLDNLEEFENKSVYYAVKDKDKFKGKTVVIAGGGDSAVDWAVALAPSAAHVHVVHRRPDFRAAEATVAQLHNLAEAGKVTLHAPTQLTSISGVNGQLQNITLTNFEGDVRTLTADYMLCFYGLAPSLGPVAQWGLDLHHKKIAVEPTSMKTNVPGLFAVGDIADYPGKISLILVGFAEAAMAAKSVQEYINPEKKFKVSYSTSQGIPKP